MKLPERELPLVTFRRRLPDYLAGGKECFLEVEARAGGAVNPAYVAGAEAIAMKARVMDAQVARIADDAERLEAGRANALQIVAARFALIHDACVIGWRSNILDDDRPVEATRANFLALADVRVPEISAAMVALEKAILDAGADMLKAHEALLKN